MRRLTQLVRAANQRFQARQRRRLVEDSGFVQTYPAVLPQSGGWTKSPTTNKAAVFDESGAYGDINRARLNQLDSLGLQLEGKRVADVGSGVGDLAQFFVERGCRVSCFDAREENVAALRSKYPALEAHVLDVERDPLESHGLFDVVFAYGLLYHLEDPVAALRNLASVSRETLLLETAICDHRLPALRYVDESDAYDQAMRGIACRPSPAFVVMTLQRAGFPFVYAPITPPRHMEYRFRWRNDMAVERGGYLIRCVFIASRQELSHDALTILSDK